MTGAIGRDGRSLVTTAMAAYSLGMKPGSFRGWAVRHGVRPAAYQPSPSGGQASALWDLADISQGIVQSHVTTSRVDVAHQCSA